MGPNVEKKIAKFLKIGRVITIFVHLTKIQKFFENIFFAVTRSFFTILRSSFFQTSPIL